MNSSKQSDQGSQEFSNELKPEQALGLVSLGLMQKLTNKGLTDLKWLTEENKENANLQALQQRLELTSLAIETGAPLSTAEVSQLLGVIPITSKTERGGLVAKRLSRNVWKLSRIEKNTSHWRN